jgi:LysM repeat protein
VFTAALSTPAHSDTLIRCPDWKQLLEVERIYGVRKSPPKESFEVAINATSDKAISRPWSAMLKKPAKASSAAKSTPCAVHTVKAGDTLSKIAKARLGSAKRYNEIAAANKIKVATPLKIGQILQIPCTPGNTVGKALAKSSPLPSSKVAVPAPVAAPLPVWKAKSGEYLTDTLRRWGKTAGYKVLKEGADDWRISVPVTVMGTFEEATAQLVRGFEGTGRPPGVSIYSNKVVKVGAP